MSTIVDDKSEHCVPFLLEFLGRHQEKYGQEKPTPFFLGLNGIQGAGKTTLV
jgi:D-glycerate 3-kinase